MLRTVHEMRYTDVGRWLTAHLCGPARLPERTDLGSSACVISHAHVAFCRLERGSIGHPMRLLRLETLSQRWSALIVDSHPILTHSQARQPPLR